MLTPVFRLFVNGLGSPDTGRALRTACGRLEERLLGCAASCIPSLAGGDLTLNPCVLNPRLPSPPIVARYRKKPKKLELGVSLEYERWNSATEDERIVQLAAAMSLCTRQLVLSRAEEHIRAELLNWFCTSVRDLGGTECVPASVLNRRQIARAEAEGRVLYREIGNELHYYETWVDGARAIEHFGRVGTTGTTRVHAEASAEAASATARSLTDLQLAQGYVRRPDDDFFKLLIEYKIDDQNRDGIAGWLSDAERVLTEKLGWHGVGLVDGHSFGKTHADILCLVVDCAIATRLAGECLHDLAPRRAAPRIKCGVTVAPSPESFGLG